DLLWSAAVSASFVVVILMSPIMGAIADFRAIQKPMLMILGLLCAIMTCALALIPLGQSNAPNVTPILIAMAIYIPANVLYALGENFLAAFLPEISERRTMGRVSGFGWSMGYVGALLLLIICGIAMTITGRADSASFRPYFVFAGVWFIIMAIPTLIFLGERAVRQPTPEGHSLVRVGFERLGQTARAATRFRHLLRFLGAFLVYGFGVQVIIFFASPIAEAFGFAEKRLVIFVLILTVVAGVAAVTTTFIQDRIGHRRTVFLFLIVWTINALGLAAMAWYKSQAAAGVTLPQWPVWVVGAGLGLGLGGIGSSSRALVGAFTPAHRTAEFFGLWGLTYKLAGAIGVLMFGVTRSLLGETASLVLLAGFFVVGFCILLTVSEREGVAAAHEEEDRHRKSGGDALPPAAGLGAGGPVETTP
ncbi:MAG: MFS transporter, partial [Phycisphaerales bacterium]|nr:MFS transporter [Phycisphaerales bacterium]